MTSTACTIESKSHARNPEVVLSVCSALQRQGSPWTGTRLRSECGRARDSAPAFGVGGRRSVACGDVMRHKCVLSDGMCILRVMDACIGIVVFACGVKCCLG